ncbi:MAG: hypothetical protein F6J95_027890 [Leptolyngbya sp. SIO1E4]|nr:hypothetical protein [Leptolyngbya sp. SIO1E4]
MASPETMKLPESEALSLPELFEKADAIAARPIDQELSATPIVEAQSTETQPPFDYQHTLERLREDTQALPEPLRDSILNAIQAAEAHMSEEPQLPADASLEKVSAGGLVQAAIAQNDPDLQAQMLDITPVIDRCMGKRKHPLAHRGLEPDEGKLSSSVLRGKRSSDVFLSYPTTFAAL